MDVLRVAAAWRERLKGDFSRWTSSLLVPGRSIHMPFGDMVVTQRVTQHLSAGEQSPPRRTRGQALVGSRTVLTGPTGSGKSTWLHGRFNELIADPGALPVLLDLEDLRARWEQVDHSLDRWVEQSVLERVPEASAGWMQAMNEHPGCPRVVLMLDGWDTLGPSLGEKVRPRLLGLQNTHPRLSIVVASRPGAHGLPDRHDRYAELQLLPLDDRAIEMLSGRVLRARLPLLQAEDSAQRFADAFDSNPQARELAGRPLLLLMMLLLEPEEPLPRFRHRLYAEVIDILLAAGSDHRLPESIDPDATDILATLSRLAHTLTVSGHQRQTVSRFLRILPGKSSRHRRDWLGWLSGPAGVLEERSGWVSFIHTSLQEYLTAVHLDERYADTNNRQLQFLELASRPGWRPVLRLWAALAEEQQPDSSRGLVRHLVQAGGIDALEVAGTLLADGLGDSADFLSWGVKWRDVLRAGWPPGGLRVAQIWAKGPKDRSAQLGDLLIEGIAVQNWAAWLRTEEWYLDAMLPGDFPKPVQGSMARAVVDAYGGYTSEVGVAASRFLAGGSPTWPGVPYECALIQVWPSRRPPLARFLQLLASLGADRATLRDEAGRYRSPEIVDGAWQRHFRSEWSGYLCTDATYQLGVQWAVRLATSGPRTPPPFGPQAMHELMRDAQVGKEQRPDYLKNWVSEGEYRHSNKRIIQAAVLQREGLATVELDRVIRRDGRESDPLWLALARVVAHGGTPADRALLEGLAAAPDQRRGHMRWALKYFVRGDVVLADGTTVTLDELGVELPLLDPAPERAAWGSDWDRPIAELGEE